MLQRLEQWSAQIGMKLEQSQIEAMQRFWRLVLETNEHTNLTRITEDEAATLKHFVDSLTVLRTGIVGEGARLVDIGTGAGFPGIPLKIVRPDLRLTLIDSTLKRVRFLDNVIDTMSLKHAEAVHGRAEQLGTTKPLTGAFDVAVARAVARLPRLASLCLPFVRPGGYFVAMKGPDVNDEVVEAEAVLTDAGATVEAVEQFALPADAGRRSLVVIRKGR